MDYIAGKRAACQCSVVTPRTILMNGKNEQHHTGKGAEGGDQSTDAMSHAPRR